MKKFLLTIILLLALPALVQAQPAEKWTGLSKYAVPNSRLVAARNMGNRVVMMGNSITEFWATVDPDFFKQHPNFIDRGISGQTTYQMVVRFRDDVINLQPRVVVIAGGINDIAENKGIAYNENRTLGNIMTMVELARLHKIKPVICAVTPCARIYWNENSRGVQLKIMRLNELLKNYCQREGLPFVDYYTPLVSGPDNAFNPAYSSDGVHPNLVGYKLMEPLLLETVHKYVK